ncbi:MAG TPA: glycosidase [Candidatus Nanoarchaeia archaeon]|nr:glycosidase [Candidatus Nanoarchaeia archaeon]
MHEHLLLTPKDILPSYPGWTVKSVINPAVIRLPDRHILMYARVAEAAPQAKGKMMSCPVIASGDHYQMRAEAVHRRQIRRITGNVIFLKNDTCRLTTFSSFRKILLDKDGFTVSHIQDKPAFTGLPGDGEYGVEDPRFTKIGKQYAMTYVAVNKNEGVSTALALTRDFVKWKRSGIIFREQNKDVVLFPERIKGRYVALHRPEGFFEFSKPSIWISYSPDLAYWGREKSIVQPREGWESVRIGSGAPPIRTKDGWLLIYHGVEKKGEGRKEHKVYSAGALLLDKRNPEHILARSPANKPLFRPMRPYERKGFINEVVFPTAAVPSLDRDSLLIYYGGADTVTAVKEIALSAILKHMRWE